MIPNAHKKTMRLLKPNPLFERWLTEWKSEVEYVDDGAAFKFEKALESLRKYPLVLSSGKECLILEHFDAALCIKLDRKLAEYRKSGCGSSSLNTFSQSEESSSREILRKDKNTLPFKELNQVKEIPALQAKKRPYLPKNRSGPFALIVTLLKNAEMNNSKDWMSKCELQKAAQPLCDTSFTKAQAGTFYTAWSCMSQLLTKQLVKKEGNPPRFTLTSSGFDLGMNLISMYPDEVKDFEVQYADPSSLLTASSEILAPGKKGLPKNTFLKRGKRNNVATQESTSSQEWCEPVEEGPQYFPANSFDVLLLVDTAETVGAERKAEDETIRELSKLLVNFEVRKLNVGDFLWVARHRDSGKELVLPYIVERKRMDDLAKSIKDGRFHEQKVRLKSCGLRFLIYLVENMKGDERYSLPLKTLNFSIIRTQVSDNFFVQIKRNHKESMLFLAQCTKLFKQLFESKTLFCCKKEDLPDSLDIQDEIMSLCTFNNFHLNIGKSRNFTVKEIFQKQLLQLSGISSDIAWSIGQLYPTPASIHKSFIASGKGLLENIEYGPLKRRIGPELGSTLYNFYTSSHFSV